MGAPAQAGLVGAEESRVQVMLRPLDAWLVQGSFSSTRHSLPQAEQAPFATQEHSSLADCRRGVSRFAKFVMGHTHPRQLEKALLDWQDHVLGNRDLVEDQVTVDGKELLNSQGPQIASAYSVKDGRWLGSEALAEGSNEIPAVKELLRRADLKGSLVTADALHTQIEYLRSAVGAPASGNTAAYGAG